MSHSPKRICPPETDPLTDRLSDLPDELLHKILAFLPDTRSRARTSVLARRWVHLWRSHPSIVLHHRRLWPLRYDHLWRSHPSIVLHHRRLWHCRYDPAAAVVAVHNRAVDAALAAASPGSLSSLSIDVWLPFDTTSSEDRASNAATADRFLNAAKRLAVRDLCVRATSPLICSLAPFPPSIFLCSAVEFLYIPEGNFPGVPAEFKGFPALKTLFLKSVEIQTETLAAILKGSLRLEYFLMEKYLGVEQIDLSLPNLKRIVLMESWMGPHVQVSIDAPELSSIKFDGDLNLLSWNGSPCLSEAVIRILRDTKLEKESSWKKLISAVSNVETLTVNGWFYQFSIPESFSDGTRDFMFNRLKELTCEIKRITGPDLRFLLSNLMECPLLEKLCIKFDRSWAKDLVRCRLHLRLDDVPPAEEVVKTVEELEGNSVNTLKNFGRQGSALNQLKIFTLDQFLGATNDILLAKFLFNNAENLKDFFITDSYIHSSEIIKENFRHLRTFDD